MRNYSKDDQRALAVCAADCAERVLPLFEGTRPRDGRPRRAIEACRKWIRDGVFSMTVIRGASLAAHAAARAAGDVAAAKFAARAAGQAVATAHVPQHAFGAAYYALKAVAATKPPYSGAHVRRELTWQSRRLPPRLRPEFLERVVIREAGARISIRVQKGKGF